jgi:thiamine biosynthesis lipoprotein
VVGIRDPDDNGGVATRLAVVNEAISTSGDYERYFIEDGRRYHHILNPASGTPVTGIRSVTVIGPEATMTDGLSTSVFVLGRQRGLELIESLPDYETVIIESGGRLVYSSGLDPG